MAIISSYIVLVILIEKHVCHGFATYCVISAITVNVMKLNYLTSSKDVKELSSLIFLLKFREKDMFDWYLFHS